MVLYSDGPSVLAEHTTNVGGYDFVAAKLDVNGSILWKWQVRTTGINCTIQ